MRALGGETTGTEGSQARQRRSHASLQSPGSSLPPSRTGEAGHSSSSRARDASALDAAAAAAAKDGVGRDAAAASQVGRASLLFSRSLACAKLWRNGGGEGCAGVARHEVGGRGRGRTYCMEAGDDLKLGPADRSIVSFWWLTIRS